MARTLPLLHAYILASNIGVASTEMIYRTGWYQGQQLGYIANPPATRASQLVIHSFNETTAPEMSQTLAETQTPPIADLYARVKLTQDHCLASIPVLQGAISETSLMLLCWADVVEALVTMTSFGFSKETTIKVWDAASDNWRSDVFLWRFCHVRLSTPQCLPVELQEGFRSSGKADLWISTMDTLLNRQPPWWKWNESFAREYIVLIGKLWKTLEVALNATSQPLDFLFLLCNSIMKSLDTSPCGDMTFVPVLGNTVSSRPSTDVASLDFIPKVRYRAQGRLAAIRYRKPSRTQSERVLLQRASIAAQGFLPHIRRRQKE